MQDSKSDGNSTSLVCHTLRGTRAVGLLPSVLFNFPGFSCDSVGGMSSFMLDLIRSQRLGEDLVTILSDRNGDYPICAFRKFGSIRIHNAPFGRYIANLSIPFFTRTVFLYGM